MKQILIIKYIVQYDKIKLDSDKKTLIKCESAEANHSTAAQTKLTVILLGEIRLREPMAPSSYSKTKGGNHRQLFHACPLSTSGNRRGENHYRIKDWYIIYPSVPRLIHVRALQSLNLYSNVMTYFVENKLGTFLYIIMVYGGVHETIACGGNSENATSSLFGAIYKSERKSLI